MAMKFLSILREKNENPLSAKPATLGFLGDSVTNGCFEVLPALTDNGIQGFDVVYEPENAYSADLRKIFAMLYPHAQLNIINAGISGDSADGGLARMERDLLAYHPDLVVVCYGLNDSGRGDAGLERYRSSLVGILNGIRETGAEAILLTPQPICARVHTQLKGDNLRTMAAHLANTFKEGGFDRYMQTARAAADEAGVPVCDCYAKWMAMYENGVDITSLLANYLNHPTRELHWLFASSLAETIFTAQ